MLRASCSQVWLQVVNHTLYKCNMYMTGWGSYVHVQVMQTKPPQDVVPSTADTDKTLTCRGCGIGAGAILTMNTGAPGINFCMPCATAMHGREHAEGKAFFLNSADQVEHIRDAIDTLKLYMPDTISLAEGWDTTSNVGIAWNLATQYEALFQSTSSTTWKPLLQQLLNEGDADIVWKEGVRSHKIIGMETIENGNAYVKLSMDVLQQAASHLLSNKEVAKLVDHIQDASTSLHAAHQSMSFGGEYSATSESARDKSTMLFLGGDGTGTGFHVDWSNAANVAFALGPQANGDPPIIGRTPVAKWAFVKPCTESWVALSEWLKGHNVPGYENGIMYPNPHFVRPEDPGKLPTLPALPLHTLEALAEDVQMQAHVKVMDQYHGHLMNAPVGWGHCVTNIVANIKIAFDYIREIDLPKIALSHVHNIVPFFRQYQAEDYTDAFAKAMVQMAADVKVIKATKY